MSIENKHPQYQKTIDNVLKVRDLYTGVVKSKGTKYLPATRGMRDDGMDLGQPGREDYETYKFKAVLPDDVKDAVAILVGTLHQKGPTINLPDRMKSYIDDCTGTGISIAMLIRQINEEQLIAGRVGLMLDLPPSNNTTGAIPYICKYSAESIINWVEGRDDTGKVTLDAVVLDESGFQVDGNLEWKQVDKFRLLHKNEDGVYGQNVLEPSSSFNLGEFTEDTIVPVYLGDPLKEIAFIFINAKDLVSDTDNPPLLPLAETVLTIYQGEADYRQHLFMQGQDTLVITSNTFGTSSEDDEESETRTGTGAMIQLSQGDDAKFIGVTSSGLEEQRLALEADRKKAETKSGQAISTTKGGVESGEALRVRVNSQTVTLNQLALSSAAGVEQMLKIAARWMGIDPDEVSIEPNLDFTNLEFSGRELVDFMTSKTMGAPLSSESIHNLMRKREVTDKTYEQELESIANEVPLSVGSGDDTI